MANINEKVEELERQMKEIERERKHQDESKFLFITGACGICILFMAFILTYFGVIDLRYISKIIFNPWIEYAGNFIMQTINIFFMVNIIFYKLDTKLFIVTVLYMTINFLLGFIFDMNNIYFSTIPSLILVILISVFQKRKWHFGLIKFILFFSIVSTYQIVSGYIKLYSFNYQYYNTNLLTAIVYSVDLYLFYILLYKGVKKHVQIPNNSLETVLRQLWRSCKTCYQVLINTPPQATVKDLPEMNKRQWRVFCVLVYLYQIIQLIVILGSNAAINKLFVFIGIEGIFFIGFAELLIAFVIFEFARRVFGKTMHANTDVKCNIISFLTYFALSRFLIPLNITLFFNIIIVSGLAYAIHRFAIYSEEYQQLKRYKMECEVMAHKTRRQKVQLILQHLSPDYVDYDLLKMFANGTTIEKTAEYFHVSIATANRRIDKAIN